MKVEKQTFVSMDYKLTLENGEIVDQSPPDRPIEFICGYDQIIPGLEKGIMGHEANEAFQVVVPPEEAYGEHQPELVQRIPRDHFPPDTELEVGMRFQAQSPHGMPVTFVVTGIEADTAEVDLNHPLAGKTLIFDVVIKSVRRATPEEIQGLTAPACNPSDPSDCGGCRCG